MPLPDRPVANTTIDSAWGQAIHDWTFAPTGTWLDSSVATSCGTGFVQIRLDRVIDDPGGWLVASPLPGEAEAPTGSDGLYILIVRIQSVNGTAGNQTRALIGFNGVNGPIGSVVNNGGSSVQFTIADFLQISAGDIITVNAQKDGGSNPDVSVGSFALIRVGDSIG